MGGIAERARFPRGLPTSDHNQYQFDCFDACITMSLVGMEWWRGASLSQCHALYTPPVPCTLHTMHFTHHPYQTPEVIVRVVESTEKYADWVDRR